MNTKVSFNVQEIKGRFENCEGKKDLQLISDQDSQI